MENPVKDPLAEINLLKEIIERQQKEKEDLRFRALENDMSSFKEQMKQHEEALEKKMKWYLSIAFSLVAIAGFVISYYGKEQVDKKVNEAIGTYAKGIIDSLIGRVRQNADSLVSAKADSLIGILANVKGKKADEVVADIAERGDSAISVLLVEYPELIDNFKSKRFTPDGTISNEVRKNLSQANTILPKIKKEVQYTYEDWFYKGVSEYDSKAYDKALISFSKALVKRPYSADSYRFRGNIYLKQMQYDKASDDYNNAIEFKANHAPTFYNRGFCYYKSKEYQKAISDYNNAIKINRNYAKAYNNRGLAYYDLKDYGQAIKDYSKAIKIEPDNAIYYNNRAIAYEATGKNDKAKDDHEKAHQLDPKKYK